MLLIALLIVVLCFLALGLVAAFVIFALIVGVVAGDKTQKQ